MGLFPIYAQSSDGYLASTFGKGKIMKQLYQRLFCAVTLVGAASLTACGGGAGGSPSEVALPTVSNSTFSDTAIGAISGFGSVIVNGVRYDDSAASVTDDDGVSKSSSSLGLGMMVELKGKLREDGTGSANQISVFSEVQGPITNLNAAAGTFTLLGLTVSAGPATVFQDTSGLSKLANGNIVEVYGLRNGTTIAASRIEKKTIGAGATVIKLRGQISALNTATNTMMVSGSTVSFANAVITPNAAALVDGVFIKVSSVSPANGNTINASRVQVLGNRQFSLENGAKSEIQGLVTNYVSINQFSVAGIVVNGASAVLVRGNAAAIANGARVKVKGNYLNNVLNARLIQFEDGAGIDEFRLYGPVSSFVSVSSFVVRGITVDASATGVLFERGTAAQIGNGSNLEIEGSLIASATGPILKASKVKFENSPATGVPPTNGSEIEFKGTIASINGDTLLIGTRTVKIVASTVFRRITRAQFVSGSLVEVKGVLLADGSIEASRISLED
jgi:hypothetical protein